MGKETTMGIERRRRERRKLSDRRRAQPDRKYGLGVRLGLFLDDRVSSRRRSRDRRTGQP